MISAQDALQRLKEGNQRFVAGVRSLDTLVSQNRRAEMVGSQTPFAVIIGCSDSRVPVEMIFDQGLGDLFVIRVAGNIVAPTQIGSVEFAAEQFGTRLVVVMGHSHCGAIKATLDQLRRPKDSQSKNLRTIVKRISPAVEGLLSTDLVNKPDELVNQAVLANVRMSANMLRSGSDILEQMVDNEDLLIVGANYSLETGEVTFLEPTV
ncbi:carbonic anhydrase [Aliiglaciecola sp. CAU 1673]|uniref:carbonic anhydrase n=1 Tax=Aliiglaciecola sp. CAU 1673 TaxID=3032595 RepID=UPI0023DB63BA|nr:carbonic anhydrase [Aliiglaciecola sp. CAU 1673]MDF2176694.1 carbonic anhydrase [Aliiglaciecola sp. CAU 1673]